MYLLSDYDYTLPEHLIAQAPAHFRDQSRLMALARADGSISHHRFLDLVGLLHSGDLLVVNNTRVVPARLAGTKETGGKVEVLLLDYPGAMANEASVEAPAAVRERGKDKGATDFVCECLVKASKPPRPGSIIHFDEGLSARVLGGARGVFGMDFQCRENIDRIVEKIGEVPLPPYVKRNGQGPPPCDDRQSYQTVYAKEKGAVAAPTAGLHFSSELIERIVEMGVEFVSITLHVGYGTFLPVRVQDIRDHQIHSETYALTAEAASAINRAKKADRRVIAVGTTSVRVLEYAADETGRVRPGSGKCDLFIFPGFQFKVTDGLITNFHLPKSTLLMLVSAFAGRQFILDAYREAICRTYRFYSYGDAMFIR
ncbi:MAG: tRNA preQ1(34) S-adenosylmethionine ribosyltransferase-isomerase QueA [Thermodesulfobacteriota bacterium]|nr:tRNA preQ1(34) S-adenosylmethionine ribosyltransferase-isomerase QueA [Thermodesulfobacteriota bacterium]